MRAIYEVTAEHGGRTSVIVEGTKSRQYGQVGEGANRIAAMCNARNNLRRLADQIDRAISTENRVD